MILLTLFQNLFKNANWRKIIYVVLFLFALLLALSTTEIWISTKKLQSLSSAQENKYLKYQLERFEHLFAKEVDKKPQHLQPSVVLRTCEYFDPPMRSHKVRNTILRDIFSKKDSASKDITICTLTQTAIMESINIIEVPNYHSLILTSSKENLELDLDQLPHSSPLFSAKVLEFNENSNEESSCTQTLKSTFDSEKVKVKKILSSQPTFDEMKSAIVEEPHLWNPDLLVIGNELPNCSQIFEETLKLVAPKLIYVKYNPIFPPPLIFAGGFSSPSRSFYGCSLSCYTNIAKRYGYYLLQVELWEAVFIQIENLSLFKGTVDDDYVHWENGYFHHPIVRKSLKNNHGELSKDYYIPILDEWIFTPSLLDLLESVENEIKNRQTGGKPLQFTYKPLKYSLKLDLIKPTQSLTSGQKQFVYLSQGAGGSSPHLNTLSSTNSDFIFLSYSEKRNDSIYFPGSTWTTGRNKLYDEVVARERSQGWKYKYLIFIDGDVQIGVAGEPPGVNPWRKFEQFLLEFEPAIATPDHRGPTKPPDMKMMFGVRFKSFANFHHDAICVAYHREAASVLLPYETSYDAQSWWYSQLIMIYKSFILYKRNMVDYYEVITWNQDHNAYPRESNFDQVSSEWAAKNIPERMKPCMVPFATAFQRNQWGNILPKTFAYDTRTYWNVPPCSI